MLEEGLFRIKSLGEKNICGTNTQSLTSRGVKDPCEDEVKSETPPQKKTMHFLDFKNPQTMDKIYMPIDLKCLKDSTKLQGTK